MIPLSAHVIIVHASLSSLINSACAGVFLYEGTRITAGLLQWSVIIFIFQSDTDTPGY